MNNMKTRYRLTYRGSRQMFYCMDKISGKRTSLTTTDRDEALQIIEARNNSERQPVLNLQIAKAYPNFEPSVVRPVENLRESLHYENEGSLRSATPLCYSTGLTTPNKI